MNRAVHFLGWFVLASALGMLFLAPLSRGYFRLMSLEANLVFAGLGHPVRLSSDGGDGTYLVYPSISPAPQKTLRIRFLDDDSVNYSLVVVLALFLATPGLSWKDKSRGVALSLLILSLAHLIYVYASSCVLVWDSLPQLADESYGTEGDLFAAVERDFPRESYHTWSSLTGFATHAVREVLPFGLWAAFSRKALYLDA